MRRARSAQRAQSLVEFSLVAPLMFLLLLICLDFGRVFLFMAEMDNAAREGARQAVLAANSNSNTTGNTVEGGGTVPGVMPKIRMMAPVGFPIVYQDSIGGAPPPYGTYTANVDPTKPGTISLAAGAVPNTAYVFVYELTPSGANWSLPRQSGSGTHDYVVVDIVMNFVPQASLDTPIKLGIPLQFQTVEREE